MTVKQYTELLKPCFNCKLKQAEIVRTENGVGVSCECGIFFAFDNQKTKLKEVVEWWDRFYGLEN